MCNIFMKYLVRLNKFSDVQYNYFKIWIIDFGIVLIYIYLSFTDQCILYYNY